MITEGMASLICSCLRGIYSSARSKFGDIIMHLCLFRPLWLFMLTNVDYSLQLSIFLDSL